MNTIKNKRLNLVGIIIMYAVIAYLIFTSLLGGTMLTYLILILSIPALILTILYHTRIIKNYVLIGILGLFFGLIIGGVFILVANHK